MISKTEVSASYRHISLKILGEFPKVPERVSFELGQQKSQFRISMQTPIQNPLMTIESFNRQFQVGEEREAVEWGWEQEMGNTMFHVVNAYTRGAQFKGLPRGDLPVTEGWRNGVGDGEIKKRDSLWRKGFSTSTPEGTPVQWPIFELFRAFPIHTSVIVPRNPY